MRLPHLLAWIGMLSIVGCGGDTADSEASQTGIDSFLLGAHCYCWYPENFHQGILRQRLNPPQRPALGWYDSTDPAVAEQHIAWAADCGIDFFTLNYWPTRPELRENMERGFLRAQNLDRIKFCIFYGTGELGRGHSPETLSTHVDASGREQLVADMLLFADRYFPNPSYLRIGGRPAVVFYTTRVLVGEYAQAFTEARAALEARGIDPFFIADEIFWQVVASTTSQATPEIVITDEPQAERIRLFDAVTAYCLLFDQRPEQGGYLAESTYIDDTNRLFARYRDSVPEVPVLPMIMPGCNDRGVRPQIMNPVIPREATPGAGVTSGLELMYDRILLPNLDPRVPIGFITTWNEWNEGTMIEPVADAPPAGGEEIYTDGYLYEGYGTAYLDLLRARRLIGGSRSGD